MSRALVAFLLCASASAQTAIPDPLVQLGATLCRDHGGTRIAMYRALGPAAWRFEAWCSDGTYYTVLQDKRPFPESKR